MASSADDLTASAAALLRRRPGSAFADDLYAELRRLRLWLSEAMLPAEGALPDEEFDEARRLDRALVELLAPTPTEPTEPTGSAEPTGPAAPTLEPTTPARPAEQAVVATPGDPVLDGLERGWTTVHGDPESRPYAAAYGAPAGDAALRADWLRTRLGWVALRVGQERRSAIADVLGETPHLGAGLPDEEAAFGLPVDGRYAELVRTTVALRRLALADNTMQFGMFDVYTAELGRFKPERYDYYLRKAIEELNASAPDSQAELDALHRLDEMARSIVPLPLPAADSVWMQVLDRFAEQLRAHPLFKAASIQIIQLRAQFSTVKAFFGDYNIQVDPPEAGNGTKPGEIAWVLRCPKKDRNRYDGRCVYVRS